MKHTELRNKASGTDTLTSAWISLVETWSREYQTKVDFVHWLQKNRFLLSQYMLILIYHREMFARLSSTTCAICAWYWDDVVLHCYHRSTINVRVSLLCRQWYLNNIVSACCLHQSAPCAEHLQCTLAHFSSVRAHWCVKRDGHSTLTMMSGWCCCYHWSRDWSLLILISASLRWIYKNVTRTLVGQVQFVDSSACSIKKLL